MLERLGRASAAWAARWVPDPAVFAVLLTLVAGALALLLTPAAVDELLAAWQAGLWDLLAFAMQMTLILVTGHAVAVSPAVFRRIEWLSRQPRGGAGAAAMVGAVACLTALLNWGLGLVVGALMAREVARAGIERGTAVHPPLLAAAGYTGLLVWHGGMSGSGPLLINTAGHFLEAEVGRIPLSATILTGDNFVITGGLVVVAVTICAGLAPSSPSPGASLRNVAGAADPDGCVHPSEAGDDDPSGSAGPAVRLAKTPLLGRLLGILGLAALIAAVTRGDLGPTRVDLDVVNLTFLSVGLLLHGSLSRYLAAVRSGIEGVTGIVILFPLYAGIMGILRDTGLAVLLAERLLAVATPTTLPLWTFLSAGIVNLFVPSGGGQVAVQAPVVLESCSRLGVPFERALMAVAYGDQWTNMLQPFWALPLLAITGLEARDILGYTLVLFVVAGAWMALALVLL